jgi:quercetin dioxygenase-like cupin family protein
MITALAVFNLATSFIARILAGFTWNMPVPLSAYVLNESKNLVVNYQQTTSKTDQNLPGHRHDGGEQAAYSPEGPPVLQTRHAMQCRMQ